MPHVALDPGLRASEVHALEALRVRYAREVRYPFLAAPELRRLDFWRYYRALHGRAPAPALSTEAETLGRCVEYYLSGYGGRPVP
jgi:hypothetical protein